MVGMPGSGKSTMGRALALALKSAFIDLDEYIEKQERESISNLFSSRGESVFRELEAQYLRNFHSGQDKTIVATGGGTPCFMDNMDYINESGISIYLEVPTEILVKRLIRNSSGRPLLAEKSETELLAYLNDLHTKRKPYYSRATLGFSGESITTYQILEGLKSP